jgi:glycosyltransferase involved in cell wall biosynthesis
MASGVIPMIQMDNASAHEILDYPVCYFSSYDELTKRLKYIKKNWATVAQVIQSNLYREAENYSIENIAQQYENYFMDVYRRHKAA